MSARRVGKILPPNATALELNILEAGNRFPLLRQSVPLITTAKLIDLPDSFLPWLIDEYGLEPFVPFFGGDMRRAIREGVPLVRKIGTPYAVKKLLELGGFPGATLEEEPSGGAHWFEFQAALPRVPQSLTEIATIEQAAKLGKSFSRRFARMYSGLDVRPVMLDESMWEDALLDDYSGVRLDPNGPVLSFGETFEYTVLFPAGRPNVQFGRAQTMCIVVHNTDIFRLDEGILDMDGTLLNNDFTIGVSDTFAVGPRSHAEPYPTVSTICKAMVVADEQHWLGYLQNTFARSRTVETGELMYLDEGIFEETGISSYEEPIDEMLENLQDWKVQTGTHRATGYTGHVTQAFLASRVEPGNGSVLLDGSLLEENGAAKLTECILCFESRRDIGNARFQDLPGLTVWNDHPWPDFGYSWDSYTFPLLDFKGSGAGTRGTVDGQVRVTADGRPRDTVFLV